jgi:hypothetical protein
MNLCRQRFRRDGADQYDQHAEGRQSRPPMPHAMDDSGIRQNRPALWAPRAVDPDKQIPAFSAIGFIPAPLRPPAPLDEKNSEQGYRRCNAGKRCT